MDTAPLGRPTVQRIVAVIFLGAFTIAPWIWSDLFPFSIFPMFSDNRDWGRGFLVEDARGQAIDPVPLGLWERHLANREQRYGTRVPETFFDSFAEATPERVQRFLSERQLVASLPLKITYFERRFDSATRRIVVHHPWITILGPRELENGSTLARTMQPFDSQERDESLFTRHGQ